LADCGKVKLPNNKASKVPLFDLGRSRRFELEKIFGQLIRAKQDELELLMKEVAPATPSEYLATLCQSKSDGSGERLKKVAKREDLMKSIGSDFSKAIKEKDESAILHIGAIVVGFGLNHTLTEVRGAVYLFFIYIRKYR
jgi:hypothetical protein